MHHPQNPIPSHRELPEDREHFFCFGSDRDQGAVHIHNGSSIRRHLLGEVNAELLRETFVAQLVEAVGEINRGTPYGRRRLAGSNPKRIQGGVAENLLGESSGGANSNMLW